jgi:superfamily I DNA/RNA helicase
VGQETLNRDEMRSAGELGDLAYALLNLLKFTRLTLTSPNDHEALKDLAIRFDITTSDFFIPGVAAVLKQGEEMTAGQKVIDYTDMLWLPYMWKLQPPQVDFMFVDEAQDLSPAQLELVLKSRAKGGRMLFVGDPAQSIMAFAGADANSFWNIKQRTGATELPLSICYRCPRSHIAIAQKIVSHIQPRPDAPEGIVQYMAEEELPRHVTTGDLILCRMTAPLVSWCIKLIQEGIYARVRGVDVGANLVTIAKRVSEGSNFDYSEFEIYLDSYEADQRLYLSQRKNTAGRIQSLKDKCEALRICFRSFSVNSIEHLCREIRKLFSDDKPPVWLSTVHRAKGLENDTVYILYPHKLPMEWQDQQQWEWEQELNLRYVAVTRARQRLVILQPEKLNVDYEDNYIEEKMAKKAAEYNGQAT